jgi:TRAP-type C4-dicarboxylate transport system substrate-binding protein
MALAAAVAAEERSGAALEPLKLSTAQGPAYPLGKAGEVWATLIRERSGGRLPVTHYPGATLSSRDPVREFHALRDRAFELAVGSTLAWSLQVPQLNVLALPWLVPDEQALGALIEGDVGKRLSAILESAGVVPVAWVANGFVELASKMPVRKPADLALARVRAQPLPLIEETLAALGARPSATTAADARAALESGQLDAQETSVAAYSALRLYAGPLVHLQLWHAHADALVFAVNRSVWDSWSEADRGLVREAALDASRQAIAMARRLDDEGALAKLGAQGAIVTRLTPAGRHAFREAARAVYDRWTPIIGPELVDAAEAGISAAQMRR